jgi:hypothetical protein
MQLAPEKGYQISEGIGFFLSQPQKKIRINILLPINYNDGRKVEEEKFYQTNLELSKRFGACSALSPTQGTWVDPIDGKKYDDLNIGFFVDTEESPSTLDWLKEYKEILKNRFEQKEIYITYHDIKSSDIAQA